MKHKSYKKLVFLVLAGIITTIQAQKFDKKFSESFTTNKDVEISINASNTEIDVSTWSKNQVSVEAFIEVEGVSKEEAEKYFKNWNFEALGNKSKVRITSKGSNHFNSNNDFIFFNSNNFEFPEIEIPNIENIEFPDITAIEIPEINFDFNHENIFIDLEDFDFDKYLEDGESYFFQWKDDANNITIKSKKEWEKFKKSKKYKELKEKMKLSKIKMKKEFAKSREKLRKIDKKKIKEELKKAKVEWEKIDKEEIRKSLAKAKEELKKVKLNYFFDSDSNDITINGKKVKIKKRLVIKVPKGATFDLNTRHCKVKLPNTKASGKVSYGTFNANNLNGGKLNVSYAPVIINNLNACTLFLNNVTDAKIASVANTNLSTNSSGIHIQSINENVDLSNKFGELTIVNVIPNYKSFNLLLDYTDAAIDLSNISKTLLFNSQRASLFSDDSSIKLYTLDKKSIDLNGNFVVKTKDKTFKIQGKYSELAIKK